MTLYFLANWDNHKKIMATDNDRDEGRKGLVDYSVVRVTSVEWV